MPLLWLSCSLLAGVLISRLFSLPAWGWGLGMAAGVLLAVIERRIPWLRAARRTVPLAFGLLLAGVSGGGLRQTLAQPVITPAKLAFYNDSLVTVAGMVDAPPDALPTSDQLILRAESVTMADGSIHPVNGLLQIQLMAGSGLAYGDRLQLYGRLETPKEDEEFSYKAQLARQGIYSRMYNPKVKRLGQGKANPVLSAIYWLGQRAYDLVNTSLPQPEAGLLAGILLGRDRDLSPEVNQAFKDTGTAHIIAISGFNIAILAGFFMTLFNKLIPNRWLALLGAVAGVGFYTVLVGGGASVVRAAVMGSMALLGQHIGRRQGGLNALAFSGAAMCLGNPLLVEDPAFQLSFGATAGLMLLGDPLQAGFARAAGRFLPEVWVRRLAGPVGEYFLLTLAAQVTTLPVIAYHFQRLSLVSLLANPLVLPPQPLVMTLGGAAVLAGLILPPLGRLLGMLVMPLLTYTIRCVEWLAGIPGASLMLAHFGVEEVLLYLAVLGVLILLVRVPATRKILTPAVLLVGAGLTTGVLWRVAFSAPDGRLHLTVLPYENGSALLVQPPTGGMLLVNGVADHTRLSAAVGARLSPFDHRLAGLVVTSRDADNLSGLPRTLERFPPQQVFLSTRLTPSTTLDLLRKVMTTQGVQPADLLPGAALDLGNGARLALLAETMNGSALWLEWGRLRVLIPGGVKPLTLLRQEQVQGGVGVLLLTTADMSAEGPAEWLPLDAQVVVWQTDPGSQPPAANWVNLNERGWFELTSDGETMWLETEH